MKIPTILFLFLDTIFLRLQAMECEHNFLDECGTSIPKKGNYRQSKKHMLLFGKTLPYILEIAKSLLSSRPFLLVSKI